VRGNYSTLVTYAPGDVVTADSGERYQLFEAAPAGTTPGAPLTANGQLVVRDGRLVFPWGQLTVESLVPFRFATVGKPGASAVLLRSMVARTGYIGPNHKGSTDFNGSNVKAGAAPAAAVTLTLAVNGGAVGTVNFAAGSKVGTFTTTSGQAIPVQIGDVMTLTAPATQDTALADLIGLIAIF
jgi:hypothetical protein